MLVKRQFRRLGILGLTAALGILMLHGIGRQAQPVRLQAAAAPAEQAQVGQVTLEWFGWSVFRLTSPAGKVIFINPFFKNPDSTISIDDVNKADLILAADGHGDEVGSSVELAQKTGAKVFVPFELGTWMTEQGVSRDQVVRGNPGGRLQLDGVTVRMVGSVHGSGLSAPTATTPYGGPAAGFVITFENGWTLYFAGSSAATQDMALWGEMYKPDAMIFHMAGGDEPMDDAMAVRLVMTKNPNLKALMPHHHRVPFMAGATTVADVKVALDSMGISIPITDQVRNQVYTFSK